jgi:hypothetical protein
MIRISSSLYCTTYGLDQLIVRRMFLSTWATLTFIPYVGQVPAVTMSH